MKLNLAILLLASTLSLSAPTPLGISLSSHDIKKRQPSPVTVEDINKLLSSLRDIAGKVENGVQTSTGSGDADQQVGVPVSQGYSTDNSGSGQGIGPAVDGAGVVPGDAGQGIQGVGVQVGVGFDVDSGPGQGIDPVVNGVGVVPVDAGQGVQGVGGGSGQGGQQVGDLVGKANDE